MTNKKYQIEERVIAGKRLGRHVNHDPRSLRYVQTPPARTPRSMEHPRILPVLDQGSLGSCTGNAAVGALGTHPLYCAFTSAEQALLNEDYAVDVYAAATQIDPFDGHYPPDDTGSDGLSVAKVLQSRGMINGYTHTTNLQSMQCALQDAPVIIGINWYSGFDFPASAGLVKLSGSVRGGHEVEVVGVDMEKQLFHAVNSWSKEWGIEGHFWFSFDDMERLFDEDGDCTQLRPLSVPPPMPIPPSDAADAELLPSMKKWTAREREWWTKSSKQFAQACRDWQRTKGY